MKTIIEDSFSQYSAAVLQSRALVDVRDCVKPSARQIFYCMYTDKFRCDKPFKKTLKAIGSAMRMYIHGDSSCEGVIMRAGQPFAMRYPLIEIEGSYGNLIESGNWAASRYTSSRLSSISNYLFDDIDKQTIEEWYDNYDDTEKYPAVLPTKGYYNIVNGNFGLGIGAAASIPAFNLKEVNNAMCKLLENPNIDFSEIYCGPDFATGGLLLNEDEVKEALKNGKGKSCKLRSVVEYDEDENCLIVKEIPYGVYTNTICGELENILNDEDHHGIERFNDLTGKQPCIKIYLTKRANPSQVLKYLYKNTSLQSHFGINMTMLENGRFPRIFTWKEALQAHIDHEKEVYRNSFIFDLTKIKNRLYIIEGLLKAINQIDAVIKLIKEAADAKNASIALQRYLNISEVQAKAILEIKLSRLAHLEVEKLEKEKSDLESEKNRLENILMDEKLFNQQLINGWNEVSKKYGDERRTKILNIESDDAEEPIEKKELVIYLTNLDNIYAYEDSSLITQKRGGTGTRIKLSEGEFIKQTIVETNYNNLLVFSNKGKVYNLISNDIQLNVKTSIKSLIELEDSEEVSTIISDSEKNNSDFVLFLTQNGIIKKTKMSEYKFNRSSGISAIKLKENDCIKNVFLIKNNSIVGIATKKGYFVNFNTDEVNPTARVTSGVKSISLKNDDEVCSAVIINSKDREIVSVTQKGFIKKTPLSEFSKGTRGNRGVIIHKLEEGDYVISIDLISEDSKEIIVSSTNNTIKFKINEIPTSGRNTIGNQAIKLKNKQTITGMVTI